MNIGNIQHIFYEKMFNRLPYETKQYSLLYELVNCSTS